MRQHGAIRGIIEGKRAVLGETDMGRKVKRVVLVWCMAGVLLQGCAKGTEADDAGIEVYYKNLEGTELLKETYEISGTSLDEQVRELLDAMQKTPDPDKEASVFPEGVKVTGWEMSDSDLTLSFNHAYQEMDVAEELLLRAAVVQTLVQAAGIDYVAFYVGGHPLLDADGTEEGYMSEESFVENIGSTLHSYQDTSLCLYFADASGDGMVKEEVRVRYNSNTSKEKLIMEQLLKGPSSPDAYPTIPPQTKILGVSVKDSVCYVNLDEGFLDTVYQVSPKVAVYSVVNSLVDGGEAGKVQILVNGRSDLLFQESVDLSEPLSRELKYVE